MFSRSRVRHSTTEPLRLQCVQDDYNLTTDQIMTTSQVPVRSKSSVCVICMKYRIIIIIIIIISMGQLLLSYILQTHHTRMHTHACTHTRMHARTHARNTRRRSGCRCSMGRWRQTVTQLTPLFDGSLAINGRSLVHSNKQSHGRHGFHEFLSVFRV